MIDFFRGKRDYYKEEHYEGIYFATDTKEILHNGQSYSGILEEGKSVENITLENGVLTVIYTDATTQTIEIGSNKYQSNIDDKSVSMTTTYGDFTVGTKVSDLEGKTYDELFDGILFPTINPTFVEPSVTLTFNGKTIKEYGTDAPTKDNFSVKYNYGAITLNGNKQDNRSGEEDESKSNYFCNDDLDFVQQVELGNTKYHYIAYFNPGPQPYNNKGVEYGNPYLGGTKVSNIIIINGTLPWYATTVSAGSFTKQQLVAWSEGDMTTPEFTLVPHTQTIPQKFKIPRKAKKLQMYNTVAKQFDTVDLNDWSISESLKQVNDNVEWTYYTYTYTGANRGSVKLIVTF